ncbi:MAG: ABC transporter substrate-binding protein, partial [Pseudobdellovibrionaceae bacterium]
SKLLPIGTGPFVLQKFQKDSQARYLANEKYWNGVPKIKNLVTLFVPDGSVRIQKLKTGECDFISEVSPVDRTAIEADKKFTLHERAGFNYGYVGFNNELEKFKDVRVRRAIAHALDVDKYLKLIFLGRATRAEMPVIKGMMGYTSTDPIKYDVKKFEALRKEVGDKFPRKISLLVIPMSRPYNPSGSKMAELIQADLKTVGIDVELVQYDWQAFFAAAKQGKYEMILLGGNSTSKDSGVFLNAFFSCDSIGGFNVSRFCNPEFEKALTRAKETTSFEKKDKILQGAMKIFMRELPTIPVAHGNVARASRKGLTDYVLGPAGREDFSKIDLVETKIQ